MFQIGQKVVCIDDQFDPLIAQFYHKFPTKNTIYTIRDIRPGISPNCETGEVSVTLDEIYNPSSKFGIERGYKAERFAPLNNIPDEEIKVAEAHEVEKPKERKVREERKEKETITI